MHVFGPSAPISKSDFSLFSAIASAASQPLYVGFYVLLWKIEYCTVFSYHLGSRAALCTANTT